jgi:hypothetical protein
MSENFDNPLKEISPLADLLLFPVKSANPFKPKKRKLKGLDCYS